jgi:putative cardiolipin synthase
MNFDPRSRTTNTEIALLVESATLASSVADLVDEASAPATSYRVSLSRAGDPTAPLVWDRLEPDGTMRRLTAEPDATWWRHFLAEKIGAWAPLDLL